MNELLAQAYGTNGNIETNTGTEKTAEAALLEELEKVAEAEGIDLNEFDDNDILEILQEALEQTDGTEKVAEAAAVDADATPEEEQVKLAEADFLGRTMAHAFYDELTAIQHGGTEKTAAPGAAAFMKKEASEEETTVDPELQAAFEEAAVARANEIISFLDDGQVKESSVTYDDEELDDAVTERAGELLNENGYDVEAIAEYLTNQQG
jgi:predicted regulator of Ras-like GTPase activity (Roadblock/LC7/MglB family)